MPETQHPTPAPLPVPITRRTAKELADDAERVMMYTEHRPGSCAHEIMSYLGIPENHLYTTLQHLERDGKIRREGAKNQRLYVREAEAPKAEAVKGELTPVLTVCALPDMARQDLEMAVELIEKAPEIAARLVRRVLEATQPA